MKNTTKKRLISLLCPLLVLCMLIGCAPTKQPSADSTQDSTAPGQTTVEDNTEGATENTTEQTTDAPTEPPVEGPGWVQDTGKFNDGIVDYEKEEVTEIIDAYPDDKIGQLMKPGDTGVLNTFHADFEDNDPTCGGGASFRQPGSLSATLPGNVDCRDGVLYVPFDANSATLTGTDWNTWSPNVSSSVKDYKQSQLSMDWTIVSVGDGAWLNPIWGCYVSNYAGKIPDGPGDGLWIAFNAAGSRIQIYHPDKACWPAAWASVPLEQGMLSGKHHVDIITSGDYSTYVYVTPEGTDTARPVCTIRFADGKIRVFNEANEMIDEAACTTNSLQGAHFSLFPHGGGAAMIDNLDLYAAAKGETLTHTNVTATPTEGNRLGLDITNKTDLVSICYSVWFDAILGVSGGKVDSFYNVTEALAGNRQWGSYGQFHYWAKPAQGYYSSSNTEVIRTHMTQLYTAGVDFIIIDLTNAHDGYLGTWQWDKYIQQPLDALFSTIMEMRAEGLGTPYVVLWVGDWVGPSEGPLYQKLYDEYYSKQEYLDCFVYWDEKPLLLTAYTQPEDFPLKDKNLFTVRSMWNYLSKGRPEGQWSYMARSNYKQYATGPDGKPEQMNIATAAFRYYMSYPETADGRQGGLFWHAQWLSAFETRPKIITLSWWNEWCAQRLTDDKGEYVFVDNYTQEYSRDLEPMEGGHGDQYYQWMIKYISAYKGGLSCPVLVEDAYKDQVEDFVAQFQNNSMLKDTFDLTQHGTCPGQLVVMKGAVNGEIREIYDFEISCPVDLNDTSTMSQYTDSEGCVHTVQKVTCPTCGTRLEIDLWEDKNENSHQITRILDNKGALILEVIE